jgi:hypothetical protein
MILKRVWNWTEGAILVSCNAIARVVPTNVVQLYLYSWIWIRILPKYAYIHILYLV